MKSGLPLPCGERILYGADYNPDQWLHDPEILRQDVQLMRQAHVTSASIGIFSWTALQPAPGVYTFEWLDAVMDRFAAAGLKVFLATPSGSKPMWMSELYPEIRRVGRGGVREPSGGRHNHCPTSPIYRDETRRINRELALRYRDHPALALWHVGNEFSGECHCPHCRLAFHEWLKRRYGSLKELNHAWWTKFWNHTFTDWSQIPTHDKSIDGLGVDWLRFTNEQHLSFIENEMAPLREITPHIPCTTNFMGANKSTDYWRWSRALDCVSNDIYPLPDDREHIWRKALSSDFTHSLMRGFARGSPWMIMECSPSSVNWNQVNKLKRPGVHLQEVLQAVANGADVIHYFQWRKGAGGFEKYHGAVIDHEGSPETRVFRECADVGRILRSLSPVVGQAIERAPVAIVYDWEARWALDASAGPKKAEYGDRYHEACVEHFRALRLAGVEVDIISKDDDFNAYRAVLTPALHSLSKALADRLSNYASGGGVWMATYLTGYVDEQNRCWRGGFPGPGLREVFGLWNEETDYLFDDEKVLLSGEVFGDSGQSQASDVVERIHAEGATVLAVIDSEFYAGHPVVLRNDWGRGTAVYIGARLAEDGLVSLYAQLADTFGIARLNLPRGVVRKVRTGGDGPVEFLFNYNRHPVAFDLGQTSFTRAQDHQLCQGKITLLPYDCLLRGALLAPSSPSPSHAVNPTRHELQPS